MDFISLIRSQAQCSVITLLELCVVWRHPTELHNVNLGLVTQFNVNIYLIVIGQLGMRGALKTAWNANTLLLFPCRWNALGNK
jgi:hypothetical protein